MKYVSSNGSPMSDSLKDRLFGDIFTFPNSFSTPWYVWAKETAVYNLVGEDSEGMEVKVLGSGLLGNAHSPSTEEESGMTWDCSGERLQQAPAKH